jgi:hypothetical protein
MSAKLKIAPDAKPGVRGLRMWTSQGVTSPLKFIVGDLPEIIEKEIDGEPIAVPVTAPLTINGRIFPHEDIDVYSVSLKKGQTITCQVDAASLGSPLQAHLEIRDSQRRHLAESSTNSAIDPKLAFTAPESGTYEIVIRDLRFDGGAAFVYRLTLLTGPSVERVYPLGARRGSQTKFELTGAGLPSNVATLMVPGNAESSYRAVFQLGNEKTSPVALDVDDLPEVMETEQSADPIKANFLAVPVVANGRVSQPGQIDRWSFAARKGETFDIELRAAKLGSPLLGVVSVLDQSGKQLIQAEPGATSDPSLHFTAPQDGLYRIHVQDRFHSRGGEAFTYRLRIDRPQSGFDLHLSMPSLTVTPGTPAPLKVTVSRTGGFSSPIYLLLDGLPKSIAVPNPILIAANQNSVDIQLKTEKTALYSSSIVRVTGIAFMPTDGLIPLPVSREAVFGGAGADFAITDVRMVVAVPTPFKVVGEYVSNQVPRGTIYTRRYKIERSGFTGPIEISMADRQARHLQGAAGPTIMIPGDKSEFEYSIQLPPWMETGRTCRVCVMGTGTVKTADGSEHVVVFSSREQNEQIIAVVEPERLALLVDRTSLRVEPGKKIEIPADIRRGEGLKGPARLELIVPAPIADIRATPVTVPADATKGTLTVEFGPAAKGPYPIPIIVRTTIDDRGKPVVAEAKLDLIGGK